MPRKKQLRIYTCSPVLGSKSKQAFWRYINNCACNANRSKADIMLLPESTLSYGLLKCDRNTILDQAEIVKSSVKINRVKEIAVNKKIYIIVGFLERNKEDIYISSALISPNGVVRLQRKIHTYWNKKNLFASGSKIVTFKVKGWRIHLLACLDSMICENFIFANKRESDLVLAPMDVFKSSDFQKLSHHYKNMSNFGNLYIVAAMGANHPKEESLTEQYILSVGFDPFGRLFHYEARPDGVTGASLCLLHSELIEEKRQSPYNFRKLVQEKINT